jgi:hypothetical protein
VAVSAISLVATTKAISAPIAHNSIAVMKDVSVASCASAKAAADTGEGVLQDTGNEETDPAWLVGALFMTSAMPKFSAYFRACCDCGFDAFAVPVDKHSRHFPDTKRPNPTFSSAATQTPGSRLITLPCGWYRPLCHCHQDRSAGNSRGQKIGLEQLHLPTIPFPLESPYTIPDRS